MPINPRTKVKLLRITAMLFALSGCISAFVAYDAHRTGEPSANYVKQSVMHFSLCVVFLSVARIKARASQPPKDDPPNIPK